MANWVKIATFGNIPMRLIDDPSPQELTDRMIRYWTDNVRQVVPDRPDLIVLPEVCDRPLHYPMDKRLAYFNVRREQVQDAMAKIARDNCTHIAYSSIRVMEDGTYRNSTVILGRDGEICGIYNKNHLVIEEITQGNILCGKDAPVIECDFGRVACAICFDLNFEEMLQKYVPQKPDLLVFTSMYHGAAMQTYWAYSCRCHFVAAVAGFPSEIRNPLGEIVATTSNYTTSEYTDFAVSSVNLDCRVVHRDRNWDRLKALKEKYGADVDIRDPGLWALFLLSSNHPDISADQMAEEFGITLVDEYFNESLKYHHDPKYIEP